MAAAPSPRIEDYLAAAQAASRSYRLSSMGLTVDGVPFDLKLYPHMVGIIDDDHPDTVVIKGGQVGLTIGMVLKAIDRAIQHKQRGTGYLFPRDDDVSDFSRARFQPILDANPALSQFIGKTESISLKIINGSPFYFRAAGAAEAATRGSRSKLKSIPLDELIFDERDDMPDDRVTLADRRLDGARPPNKHRTELGTPTVPDYGVSARWATSDMHHWTHKCARCRRWGCLELEWPDCLASDDGEAWYVCASCRDPLEVEFHEWVPKYPSRDQVRGFYVSQLHSPTRSAFDIAVEWDTAEREGGSKLREFYNHTLGLPYADEDDALTEPMVRACLTSTPRAKGSEGPCALGADVGPSKIHYQIREKLADAPIRSRVLNWGEVESFADLEQLWRRFHVACGVIDAMAETRQVRDFCATHPGQAFGCWYSPKQKTAAQWNVPEGTVTVNRTETIDASHHEIVAGQIELPRADDVFEKQVLPQLLNIVRVVKVDELTGARTPSWVVRGAKNDHLRHAHNYARIALGRIGLAERLARIRNRPTGPRGGGRRGFMAR